MLLRSLLRHNARAGKLITFSVFDGAADALEDKVTQRPSLQKPLEITTGGIKIRVCRSRWTNWRFPKKRARPRIHMTLHYCLIWVKYYGFRPGLESPVRLSSGSHLLTQQTKIWQKKRKREKGIKNSEIKRTEKNAGSLRNHPIRIGFPGSELWIPFTLVFILSQTTAARRKVLVLEIMLVFR